MTATFILDAAEQALKDFGTHPFHDKGPGEVMNFDRIERELRKMTAEEACSIIREVALSSRLEGEGRGRMVAAHIVHLFEDWDELFEKDELMEVLYNE